MNFLSVQVALSDAPPAAESTLSHLQPVTPIHQRYVCMMFPRIRPTKSSGIGAPALILDQRPFVFFLIAVLVSLAAVQGESQPIAVRDAKIGNVQLHYLTAGHGPAIILLRCLTNLGRCVDSLGNVIQKPRSLRGSNQRWSVISTSAVWLIDAGRSDRSEFANAKAGAQDDFR